MQDAGLLGSPNFDLYARDGNIAYPYGMISYVLWSFLTLVILLNVLVALFNSAYEQVTDEAVPHFMAFWAVRTIRTALALI
jgi:diacylglycerol kinase